MRKINYTTRVIFIYIITLLSLQSCKKDKQDSEISEIESLMHRGGGLPNVKVSTLVANSGRANYLAASETGDLYFAQGSQILKISPKGQVTDFAGNADESGFRNGQGSAALFSEIKGITVGPDNNIYVADSYNNVIRKITPTGSVTTFAGSGSPGYTDGTRTNCRFDIPWEVAFDKQGNLYVYDQGNYRIRKISKQGVVSTVAGSGQGNWIKDGPVDQATFDGVSGMAVNDKGVIFVVEHLPSNIRMIKDGVVKTIAGPIDGSATGWNGRWDGIGENARFSLPQDLTIAPDGSLYIADAETHMIRKVYQSSKGWVVRTVAGDPLPEEAYVDGPGHKARFYYPFGITWYKGNLFISEQGHIRKIALK